MKAGVIGRIRNTNLPRAKPLLPLFEAVVNSFHAIEEARERPNPWIRIEAERDVLLENDRPGDFENFAVTDNGAGFNDENYDSFLTVDTQYKEALGGKGLGRFCWLKAFDSVEIESHYLEGGGLKRRAFEFRPAESSDEATSAPSSESAPRTTVRLVGYKSPYKEGCPNELETVAQRLVENFLPFFLDPDCPGVLLTDGNVDISLNNFFEENVRSAESAHDLSVQGERFSMRGFRLYNSSGRDHRVLYAARHRGVGAERLDRHLPNLSGLIEDRDRGGFSYLTYVEGAKLDDSVNNERTGFAFSVSEDENQSEDAPQQDLFADGLSLRLIRQQVVRKVAEDLEPFLEGLNQAKLTLINQYIDEEAPQYRPLSALLVRIHRQHSAEPDERQSGENIARTAIQKAARAKAGKSRDHGRARSIGEPRGVRREISGFHGTIQRARHLRAGGARPAPQGSFSTCSRRRCSATPTPENTRSKRKCTT